MNIPVLTYHSMNIDGNAYADNDHVALARDLATINMLGFRVISLNRLLDWHQGELPDDEVSQTLAITLDDGSWFDFHDLDHPVCGLQRSMFNILKDHNRLQAADRQVQATSFVISSPQARTSLDKSCMIGKNWWGDDWWAEAEASGVMQIECHSWDHVHPNLEQVAQRDQIKGDFGQVNNFEDAEIQLAQAGKYIASRLDGKRPSFFAYPYGQCNPYLVSEYLPKYQASHRYRAAFTTEPKAVSQTDSIWQLPRYVCGQDWKSTGELEDILISA